MKRYLTDAQRWAAVAERDHGASGAFVYAVRTTGVYCRPDCGTRRPRRANVRFFAGAPEAEAAGYRPCKRCRPDGPSPAERRVAAAVNACRQMDATERPLRLATLAAAAGLSPSEFHRVFKSVVGVTPRAYGAARRARRAREELARAATVTEAAYNAGFGASSRFYASSASSLGMTPRRFRAGGAGEVIRFAVGACSLGAILVAATTRGICALTLGDDPDALVRDLRGRFPRAEVVRADADFDRWVAAAVALVEAPERGSDLPLDLRGTAFQLRVWDALRAIPAGTTASYLQVAERLGAPRSARAVARACAANPVAVAVPCHRVLRADGSLAGYRWGVARKRTLLERETTPRP